LHDSGKASLPASHGFSGSDGASPSRNHARPFSVLPARATVTHHWKLAPIVTIHLAVVCPPHGNAQASQTQLDTLFTCATTDRIPAPAALVEPGPKTLPGDRQICQSRKSELIRGN
jgi:hypothetical protein